MDKSRRKQLVSDYKERKASNGVFAIRCAPSGEVWVASSRHLDTQKNGIWFTLRLGTYPSRSLQAAWSAHGEPAFTFEVLETIDDKGLTSYLLSSLLKERGAHWRAALAAASAIG